MHQLALMFLVDDVDKSIAWYQRVLGETLQYKMLENPPSEWCFYLLGDIEIMISQKQKAKNWYSHNVVKPKPKYYKPKYYNCCL